MQRHFEYVLVARYIFNDQITLKTINKNISPMKLFNSSLRRLVLSNLAFTEADTSQIKFFIEAILFLCEGKTNDTRICGMTVLVIVLPK